MNRKNPTIILGGSFNPPTRAHRLLMEHAMKQAGACHGIFVPSSGNYVSRKAKKHATPYVFPEPIRLAMLNAITKHDSQLSVSTCEYGDDGKGHTYLTMKRLSKQYPDHTLCFLCGADKLSIIPRWHDIEKFLSEFCFIVMSRDKSDAARAISGNSLLRRYSDQFILIPELSGISGISSSTCQGLLTQNDPKAADMLDPDVYQQAVDFIHNSKPTNNHTQQGGHT